MIRGIGRCLQYRRGLSERFVRNHWSNPSSSSSQTASPVSVEKPTEQPRDVDFAANFKNLLPSQEFRKQLSDTQKERLELCIKQVELYCYMARKVPSYLSDENWQELLGKPRVLDRVCLLEFLAVREAREERDQGRERSQRNVQDFQSMIEEQAAAYQAGGMGYGPGMYELITNPMRRKKRINHVDASRIWTSLRLNDSPTVVFDMQYIFDGKHRAEFNIKKQLSYVITENFHTHRPLPLLFANVANNEHGKGYMEKSLGFWSNEYPEQTILPDYESVGPRESLRKSISKPNPKIVYISRYAKKMLDGPLTADAYVVCASYDQHRESIIAAHKDKIDAYRLPIQKYVKWEAGPQVVPFPNIMRIFRDVIETGGDWRAAFYRNIAKRHIDPPSEEVMAIRQSNRRNMERERTDIVGAIIDSYGEP